MKKTKNERYAMHYKMYVVISDPNTPKGMYSGIPFYLDIYFSKKLAKYGNVYIADICCNTVYQLSVEAFFEDSNADKWLEQWAYNYWSGKDGAWQVKKLEITKCND